MLLIDTLEMTDTIESIGMTGEGKVLYFDYAALLLFLIVLITVFYRKMTKGRTSQIFTIMVGILIMTTFFDLMMETLSLPPVNLSDLGVTWAAFFSYGYFALRSMNSYIYMLFILAILGEYFRFHSLKSQILLAMPYLLILILLGSNVFHHQFFSVTALEGYVRGPLIADVYAFSLIYVSIGMGFMLLRRKVLPRDKWWALFSVYVLEIVSVLIQYYYPGLLLEMFFTSLAVLMIVLMVQRPEEVVDPVVGLLSWNAYQEEMKKVTYSGHRASIVMLRFKNAYEVRSNLGEDVYSKYLVKVAGIMGLFCQQEKLSHSIYYEQSGAFFLVIDNPDYPIEGMVPMFLSKFSRQNEGFSSYWKRLEPKFCTVHYPEQVGDYATLIQFGRQFPKLMKGDQIFAKAEEIVNSRRFQVEIHMETILNRALENQSFEIHYQPIYSIKSGTFHAAEALIRLRDAEYGYVTPDIFIPAAEVSGLIHVVGNLILEKTYSFVGSSKFRKTGLEYLEVNLSVSQLMQPNLIEQIKELQFRYNVDPSRINFEVTETEYDDEAETMERNIEQLVEMGYSFSLDDYGTGYSNIRRVLSLPLKIIKIDKSLVDDMDTEKGITVLANTIGMMKEIKMELVVEGVENKAQLDALTSMGADYIQGYYFSKPLTEDEFVQFIMESSHETKRNFMSMDWYQDSLAGTRPLSPEDMPESQKRRR